MTLYDIPRLYTGIAESLAAFFWVMTLERRERGIRFIAASAVFALVQTGFLVLTDNVPLIFWAPCMALAVLNMVFYFRTMTGLEWLSAACHTMFAFISAEFMASLEALLEYYLLGADSDYTIPSFLMLVLVYGGTIAGLHFLIRTYFSSWLEGERNVDKGVSVVILFTALLVFIVSNIGITVRRMPLDGPLAEDIMIIRTLADVSGLAILFAGRAAIDGVKRERELMIMSQVLKLQYEQYRTFQQSIEMINIKYHDLKHQIAGMKAEIDPNKKQAWVERLEEEVREYRPERLTGNPVLDTVIAGKSMDLKNNKIRFTCVCDGAVLSPLHVSDICTIFGNALDNAIEYLTMVENVDERMIHLEVREKNGFIFIMMVNNCLTAVAMKDGLPITAKADRENHGYGVKSILKTAEKYGGTATFAWQEGLFEMKVLIPVK